jgi:hypothetical protein
LIVDGVIQVLGAVPGGFDYNYTLAGGVTDGGKIVRPPLYSDVPVLADSTRRRTTTMDLQEHDIAGT